MITGARTFANVVLLTAGAVLAPWAEGAAVEQADWALRGPRHVAPSDAGGVGELDVDIWGLRLQDVAFVRGRHRLQAGSVRVHPNWRGLVVEIDAPELRRLPAQPPSVRPRRTTAPPPADPARGRPAPWWSRIADALPIPVEVRVAGSLELPADLMPVPGASAHVHDPRIRFEPGAPPKIEASATVTDPRVGTWKLRDVRARPDPTRDERWSMHGELSSDSGTFAPFVGTLAPDRAEVAWQPSGTLRLSVWRGTQGQALSARVDLEDFELRSLGPTVLGHLEQRGLLLDEAQVDAHLDVQWGSRARLDLHDTTLRGLRVRHPALSRHVLHPETLRLGGAVVRDPEGLDVDVDVEHEQISAHLAGQVRPDDLALRVELEPMPCQALIDSAPAGLLDRVQGMQLEGTIAATWTLRVDPDQIDLEAGRVGETEFEFPFQERCRITSDPVAIDFDALRGPYRHRFVDGTQDTSGHARERLLAVGNPHYVSLEDAELIAAAFVTLEDSRFFIHDGFDREQIERALWHNLSVGRVSRGASTITQQTARTLFLGIDRSLGRKLQEALLAHRLEERLSKRRILELYINVIELGPGIYGVEDAAQTYFGKSARELEPLEAAHIASLAPAPSTYARRFADGGVDDAWLRELRRQVHRMYLYRRVTHDDFLRALRGTLRLRPLEQGA